VASLLQIVYFDMAEAALKGQLGGVTDGTRRPAEGETQRAIASVSILYRDSFPLCSEH
jgi:uncharacterized protein YjbJ (UPF0337 family)